MSEAVKQYTNKIRVAKKGKDVRDSIADGIDAVSEENDKYAQIKKDIQASQEQVAADTKKNEQTNTAFAQAVATAQSLDASLKSNIQAGNTTNSNLVANKKAGDTTNSNLVANKKAGDTTNSNLAANISAGNTLKSNLEEDIFSGNTLHTNLKSDISSAGTAEKSLEADIASAGQAERSLESDIKNAKDTQAVLVSTTEDSVSALQEEGNNQIRAIEAAGGGIENALSNYFALRRNNKVFTTKLYKYETSSNPAGEKMNDNADMICTPSTGYAAGRDDYQQYGLFQHFTCNFSVDENGFNHVIALEGQPQFAKTGKVQVGEVTMSGWFGIEDIGGAVLYHYAAVKTERTPYPMKESVNPDGTISPFMIHGKYKAVDIEGVPYSSAGRAPANGSAADKAKNPVSYTGMIGYMHKLGAHYCGTTTWDLFYLQLMFIIKYANTNSQSVMKGCTEYNYQYMATVAERGVKRVVLTKANAAKYIVGSYVSVGEMGSSTNKDRYSAIMHNLAYSVKVTKIEDVDSNNAAVYVDSKETFDTSLTTCITTMPWHTGSTDEVVGSDGSPGNNTSGIYPCKLQGIEWHTGAYDVLGNVFMDIVAGSDGKPARDVWVCSDASKLTSDLAKAKTTYKKAKAQVTYTNASWSYIKEETTDEKLGVMIPTKVGGGSTTGWADSLYTDTGNSGQREWLALGYLGNGSTAGLWLLYAYSGWSSGYWLVVSGVSPNGTRGEYQA